MAVVGVDFDNTLVTYDELLVRLAAEEELLEPGRALSKKALRDEVRALPDGESQWRRLQGLAYGRRISGASPAPGAKDFLTLCHRSGVRVYVVSHKTEHAAVDETRTSLREAALGWMEANGLFDADRCGLSPDAVFFEPTRAAKLERIAALGCTCFVDDLEETYLEESFPAGVRRILYLPHGGQDAPAGVDVFETWDEIAGCVLAQAG
jgi:hypothetical protein